MEWPLPRFNELIRNLYYIVWENIWPPSKMPHNSNASQKTEATPGNYWGLPIKGPGFLLQIITAVFWTAAIWLPEGF